MKENLNFGSLAKAIRALAIMLCAACPLTHATTYTWTGAGFFGTKDYLWSNQYNWTPVGAPQPGEANVTLVFPNNNAPKTTTNDIVGLDVAAIHFQGSNYVIHALPTNNTLRLKGNAGQGWDITSLAGNQVWGDYRNGFGRDCPLEFKTDGTLDVAVNQDFFFDCQIKGAGGFTKTGNGGLDFSTMTEANTYYGTTYLNDGRVWLYNGKGYAGNGVISIPGPLVIGTTNENDYPVVVLLRGQQILSTSPVTIRGEGKLWLNGFTNTIASLTIHDGAEVATDDQYDPNDPGLLYLYGNLTNLPGPSAWVPKITGNINIGGSTRIFHVESQLAFWANISGSGGITKTGGGTLEFNGTPHTYAGPTLVKAGLLELIGTTTALGTTAAGTTVEPGGRLYLHHVEMGDEALTLYSSNAVMTVQCPDNLYSSWDGDITLNGVCEFYVGDDGSLTLSGAINGSGSMVKSGEGWVTFEGFGGNFFSGGLTVENGVTVFNKSASAPALSGPLIIGDGAPIDPGVIVQQINQIPNNVPITIRSTGFLDSVFGANDVLGDITLYGGKLWGHMFTLSGNVTNLLTGNSGAALEIAVSLTAGEHIFHCNTTTILYVNGPMQGSGAVTKTGPGELTFADANTYSGLTWVKGGQLTLQGLGLITFSVTEPSSFLFRPERPREPMQMRSAANRSAA
jgi:autotransporter-associated beta strand protein